MLKIAATSVALIATLVAGCDQKTTPEGATSASATPSASGPPVVNAIPAKDEKIRSGVNPRNEEPYKGPTGSVRGTITAKGDVAPVLDEIAKQIPDKCKGARLVYGRTFREGMLRSLADALVAVTEYRGFIPAKSESITITAKDCAFDQRTYVLTYGQRIDVVNKGPESHLPQLLGASTRAVMVAVPGGEAVKIYPDKPGRFTLMDQMNDFMKAEVFAFKYPTATVTGLDGKFEITGIPVGKAKVSALLPATNQSAQKDVTILADKTIEVNLEIEFDKKTLEPAKTPPKSSAPKSSAPVIK
jgi:hypothetical protein